MSARVVIIGSGFGGLFAAKALRKERDLEITLIDRTTSHLFQPLLYQVATGILSAGDIAPSTREILSDQKNVRVVQGLVEDIDLDAKIVHWRYTDTREKSPYDYLIVAAGAGQSYFGHDEFATFAPGMKSVDDALELRSRIFGAFERAEIEKDPAVRDALLTFVVVGAGPTGVEMAGQIQELAGTTLRNDFRTIDPTQARVVLVDGADQVLPPFGPSLGRRTQRTLERLGVEVILGAMVTGVDLGGLDLTWKDGRTQRIQAVTKVWAAGVQASPLGRMLGEKSGTEVDRSGRVKVNPDLTLNGHPEVFVVGDMMAYENVPGVAQGAIQSSRYAAEHIAAAAKGEPAPDDGKPFAYFDKGSMATIARFQAVAKIGRIELTGFIAWLAWLGLHLFYIAGFKQRVSTLLRWAISFVSTGRSERVTTHQQLVGRLAMERLGSGTSASLIRGESVPLVEAGTSSDDAKPVENQTNA